MPDDHRLRPDHAPTPFTADEIRAHCRDGHRLTIRTVEDGRESLRCTTFRDGDAEGVTIDFTNCDAEGTPTGPVQSARATWADLQAHASFPAEHTQIGDEVLTGPLGILSPARGMPSQARADRPPSGLLQTTRGCRSAMRAAARW